MTCPSCSGAFPTHYDERKKTAHVNHCLDGTARPFTPPKPASPPPPAPPPAPGPTVPSLLTDGDHGAKLGRVPVVKLQEASALSKIFRGEGADGSGDAADDDAGRHGAARHGRVERVVAAALRRLFPGTAGDAAAGSAADAAALRFRDTDGAALAVCDGLAGCYDAAWAGPGGCCQPNVFALIFTMAQRDVRPGWVLRQLSGDAEGEALHVDLRNPVALCALRDGNVLGSVDKRRLVIFDPFTGDIPRLAGRASVIEIPRLEGRDLYGIVELESRFILVTCYMHGTVTVVDPASGLPVVVIEGVGSATGATEVSPNRALVNRRDAGFTFVEVRDPAALLARAAAIRADAAAGGARRDGAIASNADLAAMGIHVTHVDSKAETGRQGMCVLEDGTVCVACDVKGQHGIALLDPITAAPVAPFLHLPDGMMIREGALSRVGGRNVLLCGRPGPTLIYVPPLTHHPDRPPGGDAARLATYAGANDSAAAADFVARARCAALFDSAFAQGAACFGDGQYGMAAQYNADGQLWCFNVGPFLLGGA